MNVMIQLLFPRSSCYILKTFVPTAWSPFWVACRGTVGAPFSRLHARCDKQLADPPTESSLPVTRSSVRAPAVLAPSGSTYSPVVPSGQPQGDALEQ